MNDPVKQAAIDDWEAAGEPPVIGTCRNCRAGAAVNIVLLARRGRLPGHGWGCAVCGLPQDGALTVLCDPCMAQFDALPTMVRWAADGPLAQDGRIRIRRLPAGEFDHSAAAHEMDGMAPAGRA